MNRKLLLLIIGLVFVCFAYSFMIPSITTLKIQPKGLQDKHGSVHILGTLKLKNQFIDGIRVGKLSGLAWDEDNQHLLAVSDNGYLFHFKIEIKDNTLYNITPVAAFPLLNKKGKPLAGYGSYDAEGLTLTNANNGIANDTLLWVSFEQKMRVVNYNSKGQWLADVELSEKMSRSSNYNGYNSGLEAVLMHPQYGLLIAPEYHLRNGANKKQVIYAANDRLQAWQFWSAPYPSSGLVAMEVMASGKVLVLERSWPFPFTHRVISLRTINLDSRHAYLPVNIEENLTLDSQKGWTTENYEGLARIKSNQFMMVSDDNGGLLQDTLFTLFSID